MRIARRFNAGFGGETRRVPKGRLNSTLTLTLARQPSLRDICAGSETGAPVSELDHVALERQHGLQAVALLDEFCQRFTSTCFTVGQDDLRLRRREVAEPFQQFTLARVGAETVEREPWRGGSCGADRGAGAGSARRACGVSTVPDRRCGFGAQHPCGDL